MEYLYSDEGQNIWLSGYCNPIRYDDMAAKGTLDPAALAKLPESKGTQLPTLLQITAASKGDHRGLADRRRRHGQVASTPSTDSEW